MSHHVSPTQWECFALNMARESVFFADEAEQLMRLTCAYVSAYKTLVKSNNRIEELSR